MKLLQSHEDYIEGILEDLFTNVLDIEFNLNEWVKTMWKYGGGIPTKEEDTERYYYNK